MGNVATAIVTNEELLREIAKLLNRPASIRKVRQHTVLKHLLRYSQDYTAAERGTRIHEGLEAYLLGKPYEGYVTSDDEARSLDAVIASIKEVGFEATHVEKTVYNSTPAYAGTADIIGTVGGKTAVVDLKTGKRVHRSYPPQIAAYANAEGFAKDGDIDPLPPIEAGYVLHSRPDKAEWYTIDLDRGWQVFKACALIYEASEGGKSGMHKATIEPVKDVFDLDEFLKEIGMM